MYNGDLISREQAIEEIKSVFEWHDVVTVDRLVEHIKALPSAQKTGKWIKKSDTNPYYTTWWYECSECCHTPLYDRYRQEELTDFCPNCGARMECEEE